MNSLTKLCTNTLSIARVLNKVCIQVARTCVSKTALDQPPRWRHGYRIRLHRGLLPRLPDEKTPLPMPVYKPSNAWAPQKALFGQNDYIDILGNEEIHPVTLQYHVPFYARGMKGNEFQMLLHKKKMLGNTDYKTLNPKKWDMLNKRIKYLGRWLNRKTKSNKTNQL
ncbi:Hypothetical predicted protein [Cloeon dipterum]|uniref:Large ribosomal subunit protein mL51 n=1 Tax=Cloeon dipterum TaxID=197152 RepID=A0A8S1D6I3_9INSE|nr:Hypothetical predicted protein [Cloeon dipterum]